MAAVETILKVLATNLLMDDLLIIPRRGADNLEVLDEENRLGRKLSKKHKAILKKWNGIDLEVIRFYGCGDSNGKPGRLADFQVEFNFDLDNEIIIGSDASGFAYLEDSQGRIYSFDTDGGGLKQLANDIDDFLDRLVFGIDAFKFSGEDWMYEVRECGLVS